MSRLNTNLGNYRVDSYVVESAVIAVIHRVPENNFYRRLKAVLNLEYLYQLTKEYYGDSGQKSIDPVVLYTLCLVGYVENIISDRNLITHCRKKKSFQLPIIAINMSAITNA